MRLIPLTQGKFALVDNENFKYLNQWKWHFAKGYAVRHLKREGTKRPHIYMHRLINKTPNGYQTDHIDRNKLNNQKVNLRTVTQLLNNYNRGAKGIGFHKASKKWRAYIEMKGKHKHLGLFLTKAEALLVRKKALDEVWKSTAALT